MQTIPDCTTFINYIKLFKDCTILDLMKKRTLKKNRQDVIIRANACSPLNIQKHKLNFTITLCENYIRQIYIIIGGVLKEIKLPTNIFGTSRSSHFRYSLMEFYPFIAQNNSN